ncbi:hypothetical protein AAVH_37988, partial [Aphelenchoides avenae]
TTQPSYKAPEEREARQSPVKGYITGEYVPGHYEYYKSIYHRRKVEETFFPSERYGSRKTTETVAYGHPELVQRPRSAEPARVEDDDAIRQAVRILEASCAMLDETADRISRRKQQPSSRVRFPSEVRSRAVDVNVARS